MRLKTHICPNKCPKPEWQIETKEHRLGYARMMIESHLMNRGTNTSSTDKWDLAIDYICPVCKKRLPVSWKDVRRSSRSSKYHT